VAKKKGKLISLSENLTKTLKPQNGRMFNLFSATHPSVHGRVIAFDKATWKRIGSVRNLELSNFEKLLTSKSRTWIRSGWQSLPNLSTVRRVKRLSMARTGREMKPVTNGMMELATKRKTVVEENTSVTIAERPGIEDTSVKHLPSDISKPSTTVSYTLTDAPLPTPPPEEFNGSGAILTTFEQNPHLFVSSLPSTHTGLMSC
jgi:hypothetical protein